MSDAHVAVHERRARAGPGQRRLELGQPLQVARAHSSRPSRRRRHGGQLAPIRRTCGGGARPAASGLGSGLGREVARAGTPARRRPWPARPSPTDAAAAVPVDRLEGERHPVPVVVGVEEAGERATTGAAPPTPTASRRCRSRRLGVQLRSRPPSRRRRGAGHSRMVVAPGENPPERSRTARGVPPPRPAAQARTASGTRAQGRWTPAAGAVGVVTVAAAPAAASASLMLSTSRRAESALSSTATRAPGPARRVGEVDVERVVERRVEGMVEVDAGRGDPEPALRSLGAAGDLGGDGEVGAHGQPPAR